MAGRPTRAGVRFFTLGDADYFVGAVALVNSLRLVGHTERITFLDLGLLPEQRAILAAECDFVDVRREPGDHPWTYQPFAHLTDPSGICAILDSDVIVTRRLDELIDRARDGRSRRMSIQILDDSSRSGTRSSSSSSRCAEIVHT